jgi:hypothetical protein
MLRGIQFEQSLLECCGVGCDFGVLDAGARGGEAVVGYFYAFFDGGKLAGLEVGELLSGASGRGGFGGTLGGAGTVGAAVGLVLLIEILLREPVFPLRIVGKSASVPATIEAKNCRGDAVEQIAVVRDQDQRARKFEKIFFEDFERRDVEVVGWLVEEENVRGFKHQLGDENAGTLAAGEIADGLIELFAGKEESSRPTCYVNGAALVDDAVAFRGQSAAEGEIFVKLAHLTEVDKAECFGTADGAFGWFELATEQAQKGSFATAVGPDESNFHACGENEIQPLEEPGALLIFWTGFRGRFTGWDVAGDVVEFDKAFALAHAGFKVDARGVDGGARVHCGQLTDHGVGGVDAGFGFCCAGFGAAAEPLNFSSHLVAKALLLAALRFEIGLLFFKKTAEGSLYAEQAVGKNAVELDDLAGGAFEKISIVAYCHGGERGRR